MFRSLFSPDATVDVTERLLEGGSRRRLQEPRPGSELLGGAQGSGRAAVDVSGRQRKGKSDRHHGDREKQKEERGKEEDPFLTTAEF